MAISLVFYDRNSSILNSWNAWYSRKSREKRKKRRKTERKKFKYHLCHMPYAWNRLVSIETLQWHISIQEIVRKCHVCMLMQLPPSFFSRRPHWISINCVSSFDLIYFNAILNRLMCGDSRFRQMATSIVRTISVIWFYIFPKKKTTT